MAIVCRSPRYADAAVAAGEQVLDGAPGAAVVVDEHGVGGDADRGAVDDDDRGARGELGVEVRLAVRCRRDDERVRPPGDERPDQLLLARRVLVDAAGDDQHALLAGGVLEGAQHGRRERVADVLEDRRDRLGPPARPAQAAGREVRAVVELAHRPLHRLRGRRGDATLAVEHPRRGLRADAGETGDVAQGRAPGHAVPAVRASVGRHGSAA